VYRDLGKKEHEVSVLKRLGSTTLRMGEPTGKKVILVYDQAAIDYLHWHKQRSLPFIRWLRCHIFGETPYAKAVEILRPYMKAYIT
jgi:hypothetical protein